MDMSSLFYYFWILLFTLCTLVVNGGNNDENRLHENNMDMMQLSNFRLNRVYGDGRCLFRTVIKYLHVDSNLDFGTETILADQLRLELVQYMTRYRLELFPGDSESGGHFWMEDGTFENRMDRMINANEYAGEPELIAIANYLNCQLWIWYSDEGPSTFDAQHPPTVYGNTGNIIHILHTPDRPGQPGHYDLFTRNNTLTRTPIKQPPKVTIEYSPIQTAVLNSDDHIHHELSNVSTFQVSFQGNQNISSFQESPDPFKVFNFSDSEKRNPYADRITCKNKLIFFNDSVHEQSMEINSHNKDNESNVSNITLMSSHSHQLDALDSDFDDVNPKVPEPSSHTILYKSTSNSTMVNRKMLVRKTSDAKIKIQTKSKECCLKHCLRDIQLDGIKNAREVFWVKSALERKDWILHNMQSFFNPENKRQVNFVYQFNNKCFNLCQKGWRLLYGIPSNTYHECKRLHFDTNTSSISYSRDQDLSMAKYNAIEWFRNWATYHGDRMPNKKEIWLPYRTRKMEIYKQYLLDVKAPHTGKSSFYQMMKEMFPHVKVKKTNNFGRCVVCSLLDRKLQKAGSNVERSNYKLKKSAHRRRFMLERMGYYHRRDLARQFPNKYLSLIIDSMDQSKTCVPHFIGKVPKDVLNQDLMKVHLTGVISHGQEETSTFVDVFQYKHDSNLIMNILLQVLWTISKEGTQSLPPILYLQADNCFRENKNRYVLAFLDYLVHLQIFKEIQLSFLYVGHTHEDIDQFFSVVAEKLKHEEAQTYEDLVNIFPRCSETQGLFDIRGWLEDYIVPIKHHSKTANFKFRKNPKEPSKVDLFYKKNSNQNWKYFQSGMFRTHNNQVKRPTTVPSLILPVYNGKELNLEEKFKKLEIWKKYFDNKHGQSEYNTWLNRLKFYQELHTDKRKMQFHAKRPWILRKIPKYKDEDLINFEIDETERLELDKLLDDEQANPEMCVQGATTTKKKKNKSKTKRQKKNK